MSRPCAPVGVFRHGVAWLAAAAAVPGGQACAQPAGRQSFIVVRDAETETLLRNIATPLFCAAAVDPAPVRIILLRNDGINSFVSTGNRMMINTCRANLGWSANILAGKAENLLPAARES